MGRWEECGRVNGTFRVGWGGGRSPKIGSIPKNIVSIQMGVIVACEREDTDRTHSEGFHLIFTDLSGKIKAKTCLWRPKRGR